MKQQVADKLIAALRSGKYKKGTGWLRAGDTYCVVGVLCDLYSQETGDGKWELHIGSGPQDAMQIYVYQGVSLVTVRKWAQLSYAQLIELVVVNDVGKSFADIADMIEGWKEIQHE